MKKLIVLFFSLIFILTGCYDNVELDDLSIIAGIGIDYVNNQYKVTYEILNSNKSDDTSNLLSYTVNGYGKNISEAMTNTNYKTPKKAYFAHLKLMILSESILNENFKNIIDYLIRDINIREEFQIVIANNTTPEEILKNNSKIHPIVSNVIIDILDNEKYNNGLAIKDTFKVLLTKLLSEKQDIILNSISINENNLTLNNSYIFKKYMWINTLNETNSSIYTMLTEDNVVTIFNKDYDDKNIVISINDGKTKIDIDNEKIIIDTNLNAKIIENNTNFNFKDAKTYQKLTDDFKKLITNYLKNFIKDLQKNESDILGLENIYYKKYNKNNYGLWQKDDIEINVNIKINAEGFITELKEG